MDSIDHRFEYGHNNREQAYHRSGGCVSREGCERKIGRWQRWMKSFVAVLKWSLGSWSTVKMIREESQWVDSIGVGCQERPLQCGSPHCWRNKCVKSDRGKASDSASVDVVGENGVTALSVAAQNGHLEGDEMLKKVQVKS
uniref:Uncharacterized protein n=1 Tax=Globisporangium ultimum (strain ATCC 200006 / CBS 805.95 / DAOM BR144) TaxID=431595 RepID=K3WHX4_GLOUD